MVLIAEGEAVLWANATDYARVALSNIVREFFSAIHQAALPLMLSSCSASRFHLVPEYLGDLFPDAGVGCLGNVMAKESALSDCAYQEGKDDDNVPC